MAYKSHRKRSFAKALTFRIIVIISDITVIYLLTRKIELSIGITLATNIASTMLYYLHERTWNRIGWGKEVR